MRLFFTRYQIYRDEVSVDMEYAHANGSPERTSSKAVSARWPTIPQSVLGGAVKLLIWPDVLFAPAQI